MCVSLWLWTTLLATYTLVSACFGDTWANFSSTNGYLITLDFGHVSGVPVFEALPSHWLDIPKHFMKGRNDPLGSGLVVALCGFMWLYVASRLLFAIMSAHIGISLHISALVCIHQH